MYFSHLMLCDRREGLSSQARYEQQLEEVRLLEELGYWCCWFAEHHFAGYALMPDCLLMAAAAARETRRIRLGAGVVVLPLQHHPIRVAEQAAMVDCLSHGRLELGFGRGYQPHEFAGFGLTLEEGHERFEQALQVVVQALNQLDDLTYETALFQGEHINIWPRPVQRPMPCWGAAISDASFYRYGQLGWPILTFPANQPPALLKAQIDTYRRVYRERGHHPARMRIGLTMFTYVAEDAAEAHATFERGMAHYFGFLHSLTTNAQAVQHDVYNSLPTTARLSGSPAQVVQRLREVVDYFDVTDIVNVTQFRGYLTHEQVLSSIRLFATQVMPAFQPVAAS
ncbi:MAG TPA: LLM class flavin-dependent oxidoreductase [Alphaproteobacteria bacterium]|nr:LLM class flavin-dependent oxidoreductase [Alphaproteobacteria bacterium]